MILLDTDHLTVLQFPDSERRLRLVGRLALAAADDTPVGTTIINAEEQMRGWLASIAQERDARRQVGPYRELAGLFAFYAGFPPAPFDARAAEVFAHFPAIRVGTMDLKIAAVAIARNALLLTANRRDFGQIPGLRSDNWMDAPAAG